MAPTLPSNSGEEQFLIEFGMPAEYAHDRGFEASITLRGQHWDGDHHYPFSTRIDGLCLRATDLIDFRDHIIRWVRQSIDRLKADDLSAEFQLARLPGQSVCVRFGGRPDTISECPVCSVTLSAGALLGDFHFVTDQSCLALFAKELSSELVLEDRT